MIDVKLIAAVAARLLRGAILWTPRHVVGPESNGVAAWACLTLPDRKIVPVVERWKEGLESVEQHDYSAFGAASAFVRVESPATVRRALVALHKSHCKDEACRTCRPQRAETT